MSDSHTAFDSTAFTVGALSGAGLLAGALVSGLQSVLQANRDACARWTRDQLEKAYNLSEVLRFHKHNECEELRAENARLRQLVRSLTAPQRAPRR
jgi:hypothetical protein